MEDDAAFLLLAEQMVGSFASFSISPYQKISNPRRIGRDDPYPLGIATFLDEKGLHFQVAAERNSITFALTKDETELGVKKKHNKEGR